MNGLDSCESKKRLKQKNGADGKAGGINFVLW